MHSPSRFVWRPQSAAASVVVDPDGWGRTRRLDRPLHLEALQAATISGQQVRLGYAGRDGSATTRGAHPFGLVVKVMVWYLVAGIDTGLRKFRVDRVYSVVPTGDPVMRPADFDLEGAWESIVVTVDDLRSPEYVEATVEPEIVHVMRWMFDRQIDVGIPRPDGRVPVTVGGRNIEIIAAQLAGFGANVELTAPTNAREHLARIGNELCASYTSSHSGDL
jgi:predicted DNA-binding transcriptional regulator YafY